MKTPRLRSLSVKGFRAYGAVEQTLNLSGDIAAVWGSNSTGKTSLAEAFEFLLTGRIVRRELMASSQDEFADALRNAHLPADEDVYVAARIMTSDGIPHHIKRVLTSDYTKRQNCTSRLEIDGAAATQGELAKLGIVLSQPPLEAPVLAQHTLSYIFSVRPQDRATYFKTLLEVTDLDDLRNEIAELAVEVKAPDNSLLTKVDACTAIRPLNPSLATALATISDATTLVARIHEAGRLLLENAGEKPPEALSETLAAIERILADRRSKTFPVTGFERKELAGWNLPPSETWAQLHTYLDERKKVDEETRQLVALFEEALKLPALSGVTDAVDCPLCVTESALTPDRVQVIRQHVENTKGFTAAKTAVKLVLTQLTFSADALANAADAAVPKYLKTVPSERRKTGFTVARIRQLLADRGDELVGPWLAKVWPLARVGATLRRKARAAKALVEKQTHDLATAFDPVELRAVFVELDKLHAAFESVIEAYKPPVMAMGIALNQILDVQSNTAGWQDFLDIARQPNELRGVLIERKARATVEKELEAALRQIDSAKEKVLEDKFSDYSDTIQEWWERLRPDEPTFFSALQPRKGAKRTIDFKAGLSPSPDRSAPKVRDVIAVFSQSQLHCLGLAMFLARAQHEGLGFIILDDPVLSSDEDYRIHFNSTVLTELLNIPIQVIVLTQDHDTWEELETRYRHVGISNAQLFVENAAEGSVIENTSDALLAKITRATSLSRGGHPDLRKECGIQLRDAGERFCKEMLVTDRRGRGDASASLTDYDEKTLEWLCPHVEPLLDHDASHSGKLTVFRNTVNRACHDNKPPASAEMRHACGEIRFFVKEYLGR